MRISCTKFWAVAMSLMMMSSAGCDKNKSEEKEKYLLTVNPTSVEIPRAGGEMKLFIHTDAPLWTISSTGDDWLSISQTSGYERNPTIILSAAGKTLTERSAVLTITVEGVEPVTVTVTQSASEYLYSLSVDQSAVEVPIDGGAVAVKVKSDAPQWTASTLEGSDWITITPATGDDPSTIVSISAKDNSQGSKRTGTVTFSATGAPSATVEVTQKGVLYPDYNTSPQDPDATGMAHDAQELAAMMVPGINIGNTLEASGGETAWGNPLITETLIRGYKAAGFKALRIPCSWDQYCDKETAKISDTWLERVKTVVGYCVENDMYAILNIHWDGGWLENHCTPDLQFENNAKQKAFWQQIATALRDFDEHLLFASANEPNVDDASKMSVLMSYHQTFVGAVRSTGGHNTYRTLVIQGPNTDVEMTQKLMSSMPNDPTPNRMMAEVHYYSPWNFTGMEQDESWGNMFFYWGSGFHSTTDTAHNPTWGEESFVDDMLGRMKTKFTDKNIPVVIGEYGAMYRRSLEGDDLKLHLAARAYYIKYVTKQAIANGHLPFFWDTGDVFNRSTGEPKDTQTLTAILEGAGI